MEEYVRAKKALTEGKSCGEDGITPEILELWMILFLNSVISPCQVAKRHLSNGL
jgi:hypothetical protein